MNDVQISTILIGVVSYMAGIISGFFMRGVFDRNSKAIQANNFVLAVVSIVWAVSVFIDIVSPSYETSPMVHALMGAIVGFFYRPEKKDK